MNQLIVTESAMNAKARLLTAVVLTASITACTEEPAPPAPEEHRQAIKEWRAGRVAELTAPDGWLTIIGLYWLEPGRHTVGAGEDNDFVLEASGLPGRLGTFVLTGNGLRFDAAPGASVTVDGEPVESVRVAPDTQGEPTRLAAGSIRLYAIERADRLGIRARDLDHPRRQGFPGLEYFPIDTDWRMRADFRPHEPPRDETIVNILGMETTMRSPGALVFEHKGKEHRLDTYADPDDEKLFVMFADRTNMHETYGGGRYIYVPRPESGETVIDFNKAYNPPCVFTELATCPLPPSQNRLPFRIPAGEKDFGGH